MNDFLQLFTLLTGVIYIVLEIMQKNFMWVVGIITAVASCIVFLSQGLYASMALNIYYVLISVWGLYCWKRDAGKLSCNPASSSKKVRIHLNRLGYKTVISSFAIFYFCFVAVGIFLQEIDDPRPYLDSAVTVASAVATFWLTRSYLSQWTIWIVADAGTAYLCHVTGQNWLVILYACYSLSAIYGYIYWHRNGSYVQEGALDQ